MSRTPDPQRSPGEGWTGGRELEVLHRDSALIGVNKPSGMLTHRGEARDRIVAMLLARDLAGTAVFPVHRLDRPTSGVLVFALHREAARALQEAFAEGRTDKRYLALVRGVAPEAAVVDHPIPRREGGPRVGAVTEVRRLAVFEGRYSLVEARPRTGRRHQVRRHLKHLSLPLIGDVKYGKGEHNRLFRERFGLHRLALHALRLTLPHPDDGRPFTLAAPLPADLAGPLAAMGLAGAIPDFATPLATKP